MKFRKHLWLLAGLLLLTSCHARLDRRLRMEVAAENGDLPEARHELQQAREQVNRDLAKDPNLFQGTSAPATWNAKLQLAGERLDDANRDANNLDQLMRRDRRETTLEVEQLLREERGLREAALDDAHSVEKTADNWLDFARDPAFHLDKMKQEYQALHNTDFAPLAGTIAHAEQDWPAKKSDLDSRLAELREIPQKAETEWNSIAAPREDAIAGKANGPELATLIQADYVLTAEAKSLPARMNTLHDLCGQLYDSWDKILADLDVEHHQGEPVYREEIKTVRTHFIDVPAKKTETSSNEQWVDVSEPSFHAVENDLGMAIAHKDAGYYDSEAQTTPEPAGFAYIAPVSQGSNQYGYWTHSGGESFWTFLPQYLILRELLWNHGYQPVGINEYQGYRAAERVGHSYYGQTTPTAPPKYGSHGTFTETHYASSRYVQSGGFKGSAYASHNGRTGLFGSQSAQHSGSAFDNSEGHRFGSKPGSLGKRFGRSGGFRGMGRAFGRR